MRNAIIIDFAQLLVATQQRELRKRIEVQRQPVIHLPGPLYPDAEPCPRCGNSLSDSGTNNAWCFRCGYDPHCE